MIEDRCKGEIGDLKAVFTAPVFYDESGRIDINKMVAWAKENGTYQYKRVCPEEPIIGLA